MSSIVEKTDKTNEVKLEITIPAEEFNNAITKVYFKNVKHFNIPGFRKGKAPFNVVERYYGKEIFYEDAFNEIAGVAYEDGLKEHNVEAVSKPVIDIKQMEKGKDLIYTVVVETKPEVELGKYKGIEIPKIKHETKKEDIDNELTSMAEKNSRLINVEDRSVENGDITIIDFEGFVDDVPFDGGKAENHELTIGSHSFIEGFEEQLIGMKKEEQKDVKVKFPQEYFSKELARKRCFI